MGVVKGSCNDLQLCRASTVSIHGQTSVYSSVSKTAGSWRANKCECLPTRSFLLLRYKKVRMRASSESSAVTRKRPGRQFGAARIDRSVSAATVERFTSLRPEGTLWTRTGGKRAGRACPAELPHSSTFKQQMPQRRAQEH